MNAYFDNEKNVKAYVEMAKGMDGRKLVEILNRHLEKGSSVLELGMGPGTDLDILGGFYDVTGSDISALFLDLYKERHPHSELMVLDAETIDTEKRFDGLYSNKVLMHLDRESLMRSFRRQMDILNLGGIALHSFWRGKGEDFFEGLRFVYYEFEDIESMLPDGFIVIESGKYDEEKKDDSFYVVLKKTGGTL